MRLHGRLPTALPARTRQAVADVAAASQLAALRAKTVSWQAILRGTAATWQAILRGTAGGSAGR